MFIPHREIVAKKYQLVDVWRSSDFGCLAVMFAYTSRANFAVLPGDKQVLSGRTDSSRNSHGSSLTPLTDQRLLDYFLFMEGA